MDENFISFKIETRIPEKIVIEIINSFKINRNKAINAKDFSELIFAKGKLQALKDLVYQLTDHHFTINLDCYIIETDKTEWLVNES